MNRFIIKTVLFLLPLMATSVLMEFLIRQIPNDYSYKKIYLDKNSSTIEILFLGSSHTYYGINPDFITGNSFNASHISQSLDYDYEILMNYKNNWNKLRYIILPMDYLTLFSRVSTGIESWRVKNYEIYYNINKTINLSNNFEILSIKYEQNIKRIYSYYFKNKTPITCSKLGYGNTETEKLDLLQSGIDAAKRHTKAASLHFDENKIILKKIIDYAKKNNIHILFYTSPAYPTYVSNLDENQLKLTFKTISELTDNNLNCSYYNFLEDSSFYATDYRDADHLNKIGAKKLSLKINNIITNSKIESSKN